MLFDFSSAKGMIVKFPQELCLLKTGWQQYNIIDVALFNSIPFYLMSCIKKQNIPENAA